MSKQFGRWVLALALVGACDSGSKSKVDGDVAVGKADSKPADAKSDAKADPKSAPGAIEFKAKGGDKCVDFEALDTSTLAKLPEGEYIPVLEDVWERVRVKYYDPTIGCLDWPAIRVEFGEKVAKAESGTEAYRLMNDMLGRLEQSHFKLHQPGRGDEEAQGPASPDLELRYIDEEILVVRTGIPAVPLGAKLEAVDGKNVSDVVDRAKKKSGRPAELAFAVARGAAAWVSCGAAGDSHKLTLKQGETVVDAEVTCKRPEGELVTLGNLSNVPTRVSHRMIEGTTIGVIAFNVWMLPMLDRIKAALEELRGKGMTGLVLDLRGNPGGVGPMAVSVGRLLLTDKATLGKLQYRKFAQEFNVTPDPGAFDGPIAVLVDEGTASTSEIFAQGVADIGRATIVGGGPSAGAALPSIIEELEGGALLQYAVGDYHSPKGTAVEGKGVQPEVLVDEKREDFVAGRDAVLDAAVEHLKKKLK